MKKYLVLSLVLFCSCVSRHQDGDKDKMLVVSISPIEYIARGIVGDDMRIEVLVPPGASPETYEPTSSQMISVAKAQLIATTGLIDFEKQLSAKISHQDSDNKVIDLSSGVDLIQGDCSHSSGHAHSHGIDPHIWSSPRNLKIMAGNLYRQIALLYPDSIVYRANYERFCAKMDSLDQEIAAKINASDQRYFIIYHPALTYFARDYGLEQVSLEDEGKEPSADKIKTLVSRARADGITKVFYQKQFSPATVETLAAEIGARCVEIDPLADDVSSNLLYITDLISGK